MKLISLVFILALTGSNASAFRGEYRGNWICVFTANYRMSVMSYWGDYANSRNAAYANALAKCHREAIVPQNCKLYTCETQDNSEEISNFSESRSE